MVPCLEFFLPPHVVEVSSRAGVRGISSVFLRISQENILITAGLSEVNGKEQDSFKA